MFTLQNQIRDALVESPCLKPFRSVQLKVPMFYLLFSVLAIIHTTHS